MTDPLVLLGITGLFSLLNLLTLGSLLRHDRSVPCFLAANVFLILAVVCYCLRYLASPWVSIALANGLYFAANLLLVVGCRHYFSRPLHLPWLLLPWLLASSLLSYFYFGVESYPLRVLIGSIYCAYTCLFIGITITRHRPRERPRYSYAFTSGLAYLCAVLHLLRGGLHMLSLSGDREVAEASTASLIFLTIGTLLMPAVSVGMIMMVHDRIAAALESIASKDFLTGTLSRRAWMQAFETALQEGQQPLSVAVLDIDHFKRINDQYGHAAGDAVLCQFAGWARSLLRREDELGRLGGEEFVILFLQTEAPTVQRILQRLRTQTADNTCLYEGLPIRCTFSAGVAIHDGTETAARLLARADAALYRAKEGGRNRVIMGELGAMPA